MKYQHIITISGGVSSWAAGRVAIDRGLIGDENAVLLFCDTLFEDDSTYRFLDESVADLDLTLVRLCDGRTPWELFEDQEFLGNSRAAICSRILKRELMDRWRKENYDPEDSWHYVGLDIYEINRFETHKEAMLPYRARASLIEFGIDKAQCLSMAQERGLTLPDAYADGFSHSNCRGLCVQAGQGHYGRLLRLYPERYIEAMEFEERWQAQTGKNNTFLMREVQGKRIPLSLRQLKDNLENQLDFFPQDDGGGCGCALSGQDESQLTMNIEPITTKEI